MGGHPRGPHRRLNAGGRGSSRFFEKSLGFCVRGCSSVRTCGCPRSNLRHIFWRCNLCNRIALTEQFFGLYGMVPPDLWSKWCVVRPTTGWSRRSKTWLMRQDEWRVEDSVNRSLHIFCRFKYCGFLSCEKPTKIEGSERSQATVDAQILGFRPS